MNRLAPFFLTLWACIWILVSGSLHAAAPEKAVFVHYMPWFSSKPVSGQWGWHWTMNRRDPDRFDWESKREIASHDYPLIGPYDSGDDDALESHVLLMKCAGIHGVIVDWYGTGTLHDHAANHERTQKLIPWLKRAGLQFAICYEDQGLKDLKQGADVRQAEADVAWLRDHWFGDAAYLKMENRPVLLVFGPQHLDWRSLNVSWNRPPLVFGLPHLSGKQGLDGAFLWPPVNGGKTVSREQWAAVLESAYKNEGRLIASAFPGFRDYYKQAGVHESYGSIGAAKGTTFAESLRLALDSGAKLVQLATWNDYGEGTVLEPTLANGFRYLEHLQRARRAGNPADLRLPVMLYQLRKRGGNVSDLKKASDLLFESKFVGAEALLAKVAGELGRQPAKFADAQDKPDDNYRLLTDVLYRDGKQITDAMNQRCRLDVYFPATKRPFQTVVWFHGGGLTGGERTIPVPLRNQGLAVVAVNYRLGPEAHSPAYIEDAAAAVAWTFNHIGSLGGDPGQVFVSGHSAGAYLASMVGLDKQWLGAFGRDADTIAGLVPLSGQMITHFAIREERAMAETQPLVDQMAPLFHVRKTCPPLLIVTGDREKELMGRYEENAYFWRAMKLAGHSDVTLHELQGFDHGGMPEPAFPLLLKFVRSRAGQGPR